MSVDPPVISIFGAVEGIVDEAVLRRIIRSQGGEPGTIYGKSGKEHLLKRLANYNNAAQFNPWSVLIDLDRGDCAPAARQLWLPVPARLMCFRIAVREIESWLLADSERIASFLAISPALVPRRPEEIEDPKLTVVNLARKSQKREIRDDIVPRPNSGRNVGIAYDSRMIEFAESYWRPSIAERNSDSLMRCLRCIRELIETSIQAN